MTDPQLQLRRQQVRSLWTRCTPVGGTLLASAKKVHSNEGVNLTAPCGAAGYTRRVRPHRRVHCMSCSRLKAKVEELFALSVRSTVVTAVLALVPALARAQELAITNAHVVDVVRGRILPGQTVLVSGNRIRQIGDALHVSVPVGARVIEGTGKYLMPGLLDMHAHVHHSGRPTEIDMPLFIANGVTGVRVMRADCETSDEHHCLEAHRDWQERIEAGTLLGPRLLALASWAVGGDEEITSSMPAFFKASTAVEGRELARYFKNRGVDFIKVYTGIPREGYLGLAEEARKLSLPFAGHQPAALSLIEISNAGQASVEHAVLFLRDCFPGADSVRRGLLRLSATDLRRRRVDDYDPQICAPIFDTFKRNSTWYVPTHLTRKMDAFADDSAYRNDPRLKYVPRAQRIRWNDDANGMVKSDTSRAGRRSFLDFYRKGLAITGQAFRAGVPIMLGTDAGDTYVFPGFSVHDELEELVLAGLTPAEALQAATYRGAEFLGRTQDLGSVEEGRLADLVLLDANPLERIGNTRRIHAVIFNGLLLERARLDALLARVETAAQSHPLSGPRLIIIGLGILASLLIFFAIRHARAARIRERRRDKESPRQTHWVSGPGGRV